MHFPFLLINKSGRLASRWFIYTTFGFGMQIDERGIYFGSRPPLLMHSFIEL